MARVFITEVANPSAAFATLSAWARSLGVSVSGDAASGRFSGRPSGLAALLYPVISGTYSVSGTTVTIQTDQDLPVGEVSKRLARAGLQLTQYR
jgi:hypothetical protein